MPEASAGAGGTVLVVEDDESIAGLLTLLLASVAPRVLRARDGAECLRVFQSNPAAIARVIMDCGLPDVHGGALCQRLRAAVPGLPVLLTSGRTQPELLRLLAADGPVEFLPKPYLPAEAVKCVRALLPTRVAA
jgi:two-component system cell cycle sensor histidine kinase/response regulator CckA